MSTKDQSVVGDASFLRGRRLSPSCPNLNIKVASNIQEAGCSVPQYTADRLPAISVAEIIQQSSHLEDEIRKHASELERVAGKQLAELQKKNESLERELLESRRTKALVEHTQERYASLLESKLVGICVVRGGKITYSNTRFSEVFCYSRLELFGKRFIELVHPEGQSTAERMFEKLSKHASVYEGPVSIRAVDKSGRLIWLDIGLSLRDKNVESGILVNIVDITAKEEVTLSLRDSEKQLRVLSCQLIDSQEIERKRIAAELHDGLGQLMGAIKYKVEEIIVATANGSRSLHTDQLEKVVNDISGAMDEVRNIAMDLRPSTLDDLGVLLTLEWFCREFQNTYSGIKIEKRTAIEESSISENRKLVIYRIVQEAMNNVVKYANATVIGLELTERLGGVHLCISDNGQGFDISLVPRESCAHGFGLRSMRERAEISGGVFSIESAVGEGSSIQVFWPGHASSECQPLD